MISEEDAASYVKKVSEIKHETQTNRSRLNEHGFRKVTLEHVIILELHLLLGWSTTYYKCICVFVLRNWGEQ